MQSCALPARLHAGIFPFLAPLTFTPCLLSHAFDGVVGAYEMMGSVRLLACSSPVLKVWVPFGSKVPKRSRKPGRWDLTRE